jgi:glycosyltransferase involved in cell wall biosynthesis
MRKILILCDVIGWAWDIKAKQIKKHLSDEFDITLQYRSHSEKIDRSGYDIYFTFECNHVHLMDGVPAEKKITGVTAHTYVNYRDYVGLLNKAKTVHANSVILVNELKRIHKNVFYVPNGVDETLFPYVERDITQPFTVSYAGKDNKYKGLPDVIKPACKKAEVELITQACKHNHPNRIDHCKMPDFFSNSDCVLVASDTDGTPNQLLEAASTGRTFIGNVIGNIPEFVNEGVNGFMIQDKRDIKSYVEKLVWLKEHREECKQMGIEARKTIEEGWTWKKQAENYRETFRSI